jgi:hypothetical protein
MAFDEQDPALALDHARFAATIGGRVGVTRETYGVLAYRNGDFRTASRELRTAMRITGATDLLPMLADTERGMGRPERALELAASEDAEKLDVAGTIELMIVVAGAYADTGDIETALRTLDIPALRAKVDGRWQVRLWVAYADLLEKAGREDESRRWLTLAADADTEYETDAAERIGRSVPAPAVPETWYDGESIDVTDTFSPEDAAAADAADAADAASAKGGANAAEVPTDDPGVTAVSDVAGDSSVSDAADDGSADTPVTEPATHDSSEAQARTVPDEGVAQ